MDEKLLTADEVAELLAIGRQRVYQFVREGGMPVIRLGERQFRFIYRDVVAWAEKRNSMFTEEKENEK